MKKMPFLLLNLASLGLIMNAKKKPCKARLVMYWIRLKSYWIRLGSYKVRLGVYQAPFSIFPW